MPVKIARSTPRPSFGLRELLVAKPYLPSGFQGRCKIATLHAGFGVFRGMSVDGSTYLVQARDGAELKVTLADSPQIAGVVKASLSDIKQGSFVGITGMPRPDGSQTALEVHIFPESMRGTRRRTLLMGPSTPEHDDQCERSTNRHGG
jgi:hypothetical protein